jgi:hypothetical protein
MASVSATDMTDTNNILPDWIERQATLGANVSVDGERTEENFYLYLLTVCCPLIFESYAIVLHPYWINWKVKDLISSGLTIKENQVENIHFERVNWTEFFKFYGYDFNVSTANQTQEKISQKLLSGKTKQTNWPVYIWFPGEGNCETKELKFIFSRLTDVYGDTESNFYYCLLKTEKLDEEKVFKGKLSEFDELSKNKDLRDNPTAIFPDNKTWCIISDYDLPFTYIGGTKEFIDSLIENKEFDIYEIKPIFNEKLEMNTSH